MDRVEVMYRYVIVFKHGEITYKYGKSPSEAKNNALKYINELKMIGYTEVKSKKAEKLINIGDQWIVAEGNYYF